MSFPVGINHNITNTEYHADEAISSSFAKTAYSKTIAHAEAQKNNFTTTPAMQLGTAVHSLFLESIAPIDGGATRRGKGWIDAQQEAKQLNTIALNSADFKKCYEMVKALKNNPVIGKFVRNKRRKIEHSMFAEHSTGLRIKCRPDMYFANGIVCDVKTTVNADPHIFTRQIVGPLSYHIQAAWYITVMRLCGLHADRFMFLNVEKEPPFATSVVELSPHMLEHSISLVEWLIPKIQKANESQLYSTGWPEIHVAELPDWAV